LPLPDRPDERMGFRYWHGHRLQALDPLLELLPDELDPLDDEEDPLLELPDELLLPDELDPLDEELLDESMPEELLLPDELELLPDELEPLLELEPLEEDDPLDEDDEPLLELLDEELLSQFSQQQQPAW
jgi:hypothetical protein